MTEFVEVPEAKNLKSGQMTMARLGGNAILIARVGDRFYAVNNTCPHMGGNLSRGALNGTILTCPRHHSQFDISDGHVIRWTDWTGVTLSLAKLIKAPRPLKTHPVIIEGEKVLVGSEETAATV